jgi:GxxExxY protein
MNTNRDELLLLKSEVFQIVGCAIEVLNTLGHGLLEKPYENALVVEFGLRNIPYRQQPAFDILYKAKRLDCSSRTSSFSTRSWWTRR